MKLLSRLVRLPLRLVPRSRVMRVLSGSLAGARWIAGASTHGCWLGTYERETQAAFTRYVKRGDVVYDIGANAGFFMLLASRLADAHGAVYAFEPMPRNLEYLRKHIALNAAANVTVIDAAVAAKSGHARFAVEASPSMGHLDASGDLEVRLVSIDELVTSEIIRPPQFLKIDVEGAELDVLTGAAATLRQWYPVILLSNHGSERHEQCCAYLATLGYRIETVRDGRKDGQYTVLATA